MDEPDEVTPLASPVAWQRMAAREVPAAGAQLARIADTLSRLSDAATMMARLLLLMACLIMAVTGLLLLRVALGG